MSEPTAESYKVKCPKCSKEFDAAKAPLCSCLVAVRTPSCPSCGGCFCSLPDQERQRFWSTAPPSLWARRLNQRFQNKRCDAPDVPIDLRRPLILVADDERDTLAVACMLLRSFGYGSVPSEDGQEAFEAALRFKPDLVLTDAMMPRLDGRRLSSRIKEMPELASTKVVIMTGLFKKEQHKTEALREFHADAYLKKPVAPEELRSLLSTLVGPPQKVKPRK